jgi:hypothetical protein
MSATIPAAQIVAAPSLMDAAVTYGRAGCPVFPCRETRKPDGRLDKSPYTEHGFFDASTDVEQLTRWWLEEYPRALIGMPVPEGHVVVDVDDFDAFDDLDRRDLEVPDTLTAATPRGEHLWYLSPLGVHIRPKVGVIPHADLRGPGSYVIVPPSPGYRWIVLSDSLPFLDEGIVRLTRPRKPISRPAWPQASLAPRSDLAPLSRALRTERVGNRNALLHWAANRARDDGVPEAVAEPILLDAFLADEPTDNREREGRATIRSAYR